MSYYHNYDSNGYIVSRLRKGYVISYWSIVQGATTGRRVLLYYESSLPAMIDLYDVVPGSYPHKTWGQYIEQLASEGKTPCKLLSTGHVVR